MCKCLVVVCCVSSALANTLSLCVVHSWPLWSSVVEDLHWLLRRCHLISLMSFINAQYKQTSIDTESLACSWKQSRRKKKVQNRENGWWLFEPMSTHVASKLFISSLFAMFGPEFTTRVPNIRIENVTLILQRYDPKLAAHWSDAHANQNGRPVTGGITWRGGYFQCVQYAAKLLRIRKKK